MAAPVPANAGVAAALLAAEGSPLPPGPLLPADVNRIRAGKTVKRQREATDTARAAIHSLNSKELGDEAVYTLLSTMAAVPAAVLPPGIPPWAALMQAQLTAQLNAMQAQLNAMQLQATNAEARICNGLARLRDPLRPLLGGAPPAIPPGFPATVHALETMTAVDVTALLQFYFPGIVIAGTLAARRATLRQFLGVREL